MSPDAATPAPDETRDWTFVVREECSECGFHPGRLTVADVPDRIRATIAPWSQVLHRPALTTRPAAGVWSPLEYACHARDVCRTFSDRLALILSSAGVARFADWDQNRAQVDGLYNDADPQTVASEYRTAATALADAFAEVDGPQWELEGVRGDGAVFTTRTLAAYLVHDLEHHLVDVG